MHGKGHGLGEGLAALERVMEACHLERVTSEERPKSNQAESM